MPASLQALVDGALAKRMQPGFSSYSGIQSLFLALNGITGAKNILQGTFGISELYAAGNIDIECITKNLGRSFETMNISIKPYPSCRCTHPVIDAALEIKKEHEFNISEIIGGEIFLPPVSMGQIGNPFRLRANPTVDAQFSAQYTAALTLLKGKPRMHDFDAAAVSASGRIISLASLFSIVEFYHNTRELVPVVMRISLRNGRTLETRVKDPTGSPVKPMSEEDTLFKFNDCLNHCAKEYSPEDRQRLLRSIQSMRNLNDVSELFIFS
ncbi:MAG: hypothetical protein HN368_06310 [Spirochaetales bacterium]|jgi:2-methylcitrate dehydratase PrpD|nr:hypothetical protein [Spirochaetales bacterium]